MKRGLSLLWGGVGLATSISMAIIGVKATRAQQEAANAISRLEDTTIRVQRLNTLTSVVAGAVERNSPPGGLAASITDALQHAGLSPSSLANLSPEATISVGSGDAVAHRRRATMVLSGITLPQLGAFLGTWRETQPNWIVSRLDLTPERINGPIQGGDVPLSAVVAIEALFMKTEGDVQ